ncbi:lipopolysaccharide ABC transporter permease [Catenovulum agarivorans DS-2]|uniref:Lipopolysaccharide ABC transporter permease n=1 Tax=Catenovulum agarivorans DS-2 TaxID=1328313 RepID=W7QAS2_9ALTE|nr:LPS export ABC transporter permease LptG [Catenovulum agarivorans]EWH09934.1 lipopolysaccharide ABC transporter permease [Catenovulum agarivorans DS-2]
MIKILDIYIGRSIFSATFFSVLVLTALSGLIRFVEQLRYIGRGTYTMVEASLFVLYSIARDVEVFFPMAALLGGLLGLGALASNSELIVMQAAGWSKLNIVKSAMKTTMLMVLLVLIVGEFVAPNLEAQAEKIRDDAIYGTGNSLQPKAMWLKDGNNFVFVADGQNPEQLQQVTVYHFDDAYKLQQVTYAKTAQYEQDNWNMLDVNNTQLYGDHIVRFDTTQQLWQSKLTPEKLTVGNATPEAWSLTDLHDHLDYLSGNEQDPTRYQLAFWRKIFQPVTVAVMMLVALSFIFGPLRSTSMGARILMGVMTGFGFFIANRIFGPVVLVFNFPPVLGALFPSLVFTLVAMHYLKRR